MRISSAPAVAASSEETGPDGVRRPGGEAHAWLPGQNQTLCGLPLSRTRLRRFPHVRFDEPPPLSGASDGWRLLIAMPSALVTRVAVCVASIDQPTTFRE
ncbi:hypothetical protein ABUL04_26270 [Micromonospora harpali]|uniref:hypothetical protein n=1 Tax=Micromonospora harpali TaxID=1490225 RepID=UPI0033901AE8